MWSFWLVEFYFDVFFFVLDYCVWEMFFVDLDEKCEMFGNFDWICYIECGVGVGKIMYGVIDCFIVKFDGFGF